MVISLLYLQSEISMAVFAAIIVTIIISAVFYIVQRKSISFIKSKLNNERNFTEQFNNDLIRVEGRINSIREAFPQLQMVDDLKIAFGMLKPEGPKVTPPKTVIRDSSIAYGDYLVNNVANCKGCHTDRSMMTGEFTGPDLAGGHFFAPEAMSEGYGYIPPNLTPDKETGVMAEWTETAFINRFHQGRVYKTSPMPWGSFSRMDDIDLKAIYRYLNSIPPVNRKVEKVVFKPGDKMPG